MNDILLITPPFTQINTPYPATQYLKGFFNTKKISSFQIDLGIEVLLQMLSKNGLMQIFDYAEANNSVNSNNSLVVFSQKDKYISTIDQVITFLQGNNNKLDKKICYHDFLPKATRFKAIPKKLIKDIKEEEKARYFATLYIEDLCDFITECVDNDFGLSRYAERIARSANSFGKLYTKLQNKPSLIDTIANNILEQKIKNTQPKIIAFSVPFPGNVFSAFRCAQLVKQNYTNIKLVMGGGFPNTELRSMTDVRVFEFFDYITVDDGELPLELIINKVKGKNKGCEYKRTFLLENGIVAFKDNCKQSDYSQAETGTPDYSDLPLDKYISVTEQLNPMHSLWSNGRWNKLTMAHGCYWAQCSFCDCTLDYIKRYEPNPAELLVDRMEQIIDQTGERGFHFVDEAAPPKLMKQLAIEIIKRRIKVRWWTNIRFESSFNVNLCRLLKQSGCIAVSGGLEVASNRLLKLINKGVNVEQVAQVTHNFTKSGILVHAYLMYGFPTQTKQEIVDSLEMVRQMFDIGLIQSGFWHRFALTAHSPVFNNHEQYGIKPVIKAVSFANNDVDYDDNSEINYADYDFGLRKSLFNYMHDIGFEQSLQYWFNFAIPQTQVKTNYIGDAINNNISFKLDESAQIIWVGPKLDTQVIKKSKKGRSWELLKISFQEGASELSISVDKPQGQWLLNVIEKATVGQLNPINIGEIKADFEKQFDDFELFWFSKSINKLKEHGLLVL